MKQILVLALLSTRTFMASAQITIKPGDKIIRRDWIKPSHDYYRCVVRDTAGKVTYDFMMDNYIIVDTQKQDITFARPPRYR